MDDFNTLLEEFYEAFNIEPTIKKGQHYLTTECRVATVIATEDIWPFFNVEMAWKLENMLLDMEDYVEIHIIKEENKYGYIVCDGINENYHHGFSTRETNNRMCALIAYLIEYAHVKQIYHKVREIFGQNNLKGDIVDMSPNMTSDCSIEKIETTWSPMTPTEYRPIDWGEYDEQES